MRPAGLRLMHEQNDLVYFEKEPLHQSWEEYDNSLKRIVAVSTLYLLCFVTGWICPDLTVSGLD